MRRFPDAVHCCDNAISGVRLRSLSYTQPPCERATSGTKAAIDICMLTKSDQLKDRIDVRKFELLAKIAEFKADARDDAAASRDAMKAKLADLEESLKDGWENMTDAVKTKLNKWLD